MTTAANSPEDDSQDEATELPLSIIESQERANIDMLIATAKKYPRNLAKVKRTMLAMATMDLDTAESCNYYLERQGKAIEGPSVRMAEIATACYGNIRAGGRVVSNDGKVITGQGVCHDLENNVYVALEVQRRITDKNNRLYSEDMQVVTGNAAVAIAFRNAVFKVVPKALIQPVADQAKAVARGEFKTLGERRTRALYKFSKIGVTEQRIIEALGKRNAEEIDVQDVEKLFGMFTAIKEGTTTIEEQFKPAPADPGITKEFLSKKAPAAKEPLTPAAAAPPPPPEPPEGPPDELGDPEEIGYYFWLNETLKRLGISSIEFMNYLRRKGSVNSKQKKVEDLLEEQAVRLVENWPSIEDALVEEKTAEVP